MVFSLIYINIYIHTYATIYKNNDIYIYIINIHIHIYIYEIYEINNIYIYILFTGALENHVLVKCYFDPVISKKYYTLIYSSKHSAYLFHVRLRRSMNVIQKEY